MGKDKAPAFQLYAADFYMDIIGWSNEAVGAYLRLLLYEWVNGPIPNDEKILQSASNLNPKRFQKVFPQLKLKFSENGSNYLYNDRLEQTRKEQEEWREKQRESGLRGAEERWKRKQYIDGKPNGDPIGDPNGKPNGETMALQSSSSSSVFKEKELKAETPSNLPTQEQKKALAELTIKVNQKYYGRFNSHAWIQKNLNLNPKTYIHVLKSLLDNNAKNPWPYADHIALIENGNHNEADHISESQKLKLEPTQISNIFKKIGV